VAAIDSLLKLASTQGANELRVGTDKSPAIFLNGAQKRLTMRPMPGEELRQVLGEVLTEDREGLLRRDGQVEFAYFVADVGTFHVVLARRGLIGPEDPLSLDGTFRLSPRPGQAPFAPAAPVDEPPLPPGAFDREGAGSSAASRDAGTPPSERRPRDLAAPVVHAEAPPRAAASRGGLPATAEIAAAGAPGSRGAEAVGEAIRDGMEVPPMGALEKSAMVEPGEPLRRLLEQAVALGASDLHLRSGEAPQVRVNGRLLRLDEGRTDAVEALLGGLLDAAGRRRLAAGRSVDLAAWVAGAGRFRLNVYRTSEGLALAVRVLRSEAPALGELSLPVPLDELIDLPHGLVIVAGPTGSGKSTTLAALAQEALRRRSVVLIGLEDPIEHVLVPGPASLVRQRQVGREVVDLTTGLRDALREDPDILLIGEMRDPESIALALTAAETGHLVLTSLHSRSSVSAIERIVDTYAPERQQQIRVQLADALRAVVTQRLLPRARRQGRVPAVEVLRGTHAVASLIREGKTAQIPTTIQSGKREGMVPLERTLADLVRSGQVTVDAARAVAGDQGALAEYLR
jgi:twitching motility protein PilT